MRCAVCVIVACGVVVVCVGVGNINSIFIISVRSVVSIVVVYIVGIVSVGSVTVGIVVMRVVARSVTRHRAQRSHAWRNNCVLSLLPVRKESNGSRQNGFQVKTTVQISD